MWFNNCVRPHILGAFFSIAIQLQELLSSDSEVEHNSCRFFFETPMIYEKVLFFPLQIHKVLIACGFVPGLLLCTKFGRGKRNLVITALRVPHPTELLCQMGTVWGHSSIKTNFLVDLVYTCCLFRMWAFWISWMIFITFCMKGVQLEATLHLRLPVMHNNNKAPLLFSVVQKKKLSL